MAVDAAMRKLKVPPKFMPYLEKHRIYELFYDMGNALALFQPEDHILFLKQYLERLNQGRDQRLVIIIAPPYLDKIKLAQSIRHKTGCGILSRYIVSPNPVDYDPNTLALNTKNAIANSTEDIWVLADFPDSVEEAKSLIKHGVLATHTLYLQTEDQEKEENKNKGLTLDTTPSLLFKFDSTAYRLKELFKSSLKVIKIKNKSLEEIADICAKLTMKMPIHYSPKLFRVVLIGPRGSRRRTLAKLLNKQYKLVHVDMEHLVNAARVGEHDIGDQLRFLDENNYQYPLKIVFDLLKARLSQQDCLENGYVLTNFPSSVEEFVLLDSIETPPNRVVFLEIDGSECLERLENRVVNMFTGSLHSKKDVKDNKPLETQTLTHPDDESCKVFEEIKFYFQRVQNMKDYCGKNCFIVDGRGSISTLLERVEAVLMGPPPAAKPRGVLEDSFAQFEPKGSSPSLKFTQYPVSTTEIVPLIDSAAVLRRFKVLKSTRQAVITSYDNNVPRFKESDTACYDKTEGRDVVVRALDEEFSKAIRENSTLRMIFDKRSTIQL